MNKDDLVYEFNDDMWYLWHEGTIDDDDDFYNQKHEWIDNKVIYTYECKKICDELDYDIFEDDDVLTYDEMIKQHEEA